MIFEGAADEVYAVRDKRRGQCVARKAYNLRSVKAETKRPIAIDAAAGRGSEGSHYPRSLD